MNCVKMTATLTLLVASFLALSDAFWWGSSSSTESTPVVKQIPIGYFRTYTYQPLSYSPRFPTFPTPPAANQFNDYPNIGWQFNPPPPAAPPQLMGPIRPKYPPVPPPPTSTNPPTTSAPPATSTAQHQPLAAPVDHQTYQTYAAVNSPANAYAPPPLQYPSVNPDLSGYQYFSGVSAQSVPQIQFVPCMCPVTVSVGSSEVGEDRSMHSDENFLERENREDSTAISD